MSIRGMSRTDHITAGATIIGLGVLAALAVAGANTMDPAAEAAPTPSPTWSRLSSYTPAPASSYYSLPTAEPTTGPYGSDLLRRLEAQRTWDESTPSDKQLNCTDYRALGPTWYRGVLHRAGQSDSEVEAMLTVVRRECTSH
ncbi:hypothetical protein [Streptomyces virginiae]